MRNKPTTSRLNKLEQRVRDLESLSLSIDLPKDYTEYTLTVIPKGKYKINRIAFLESINQYTGAFTADEWDYMVYLQAKELVTREELNKAENIFEEVRKIVGYLK